MTAVVIWMPFATPFTQLPVGATPVSSRALRSAVPLRAPSTWLPKMASPSLA